ARAQYFSKTEVLQWERRLMKSDEVAPILYTSRTSIDRWVGAGVLRNMNPAKNYIFDRYYIEEWHNQFITLPELKQILKVSNSIVREWRKQGKLKPVNPQVYPWFYERAEVIQLQERMV